MTDTAQAGSRAKVWFVGAGPGAADLLTLRAARVIGEADVVVWAASLVHPDVLDHARPDAEVIDSAQLPPAGVQPLYQRPAATAWWWPRSIPGIHAVGAVRQRTCATAGAARDHPGGVAAVAAMVDRELTVPEVAQSVVLTRLGGGKTPMPPGEEISDLARHGTTMAVFLSAARSSQLQAELLAGGYPPETPVIVAYRATWPDELLVECTIGTLAETARARKLWKHTLFLVGLALGTRDPVAGCITRPLPRLAGRPPGRTAPAAPGMGRQRNGRREQSLKGNEAL